MKKKRRKERSECDGTALICGVSDFHFEQVAEGDGEMFHFMDGALQMIGLKTVHKKSVCIYLIANASHCALRIVLVSCPFR